MPNFRVTVNGRVYDVCVEEQDQSNTQTVQPQLQLAAVAEPAINQKPAQPATLPSPVSVDAGDKPVKAPLSGIITSLKVNLGDQVNRGQILLTLDALKMENEIVASEAGTVKAIFVQNGTSVNVGDVLLSLA